MYDSIIIGAGAAGLFTGATLKKGKNLILESQEKAGKKILITGGGMCNITNCDDVDDFIIRFGDKKKANFLKPAMQNLSTNRTRDLLENWGLPLVIREDGKVFPESLRAQSLIDTLLKEIRKNGTKIFYNSRVNKVQKLEDYFEITTNKETYNCRNLIITTGGKSFPNTGSDGSGYKLVKDINHKIVPTTPSLANIKVENYPFKEFAGQSIKNSNVDFFKSGDNKRYLNATGDLLFTHQGLSGPVILNNSRLISPGDHLDITLIPTDNREELRAALNNNLKLNKSQNILSFLKNLGISKSLSSFLLKYNQIENIKLANLNKKQAKKLVGSLVAFPIKVKSVGSFNSAMATAGGVDITQINRKTMESKFIPGLFFAGEVIDIDGDTGGYNIQAAFSTGKLVSDYLNKTL